MAQTDFDPYALLDALRAGGDVDKIRRSVEFVLQALIEAEATEANRAAPYERADDRTTQRNGHRPGCSPTKAGDVDLAIPKLRRGQLLPLHLGAAPAHRPGPVRRGHGGLRARGVDPQGRRPGPGARASSSGMSKSEVSRICTELDKDLGVVPHPAPRTRGVPLSVL